MSEKMELFSVMFWNVENFGEGLNEGEPVSAEFEEFEEHVDQVAAHIENLNPDLFCLCEVTNKPALRRLLMEKLVGYNFAITDSLQNIELAVGWRRGKFDQILLTQRRKFQAGSEHLRPGALCTVKFAGEFFNFLFLHTDSGEDNESYNNRQEMFEKIWNLKESLDQISSNDAKFVVMGDLNTMGRTGSESEPSISGQGEIAALKENAEANGMCILPKTHENTWRSCTEESNLDNALATCNISLKSFEIPENSEPDSECPKVFVDGWNLLEGCARDKFTKNISDHCSIFLTVTC